MPIVDTLITVENVSRQVLWATIIDFESYPIAMRDVSDVQWDERRADGGISTWRVLLNGSELTWTESDQFADLERVDFSLIDGDVEVWQEFWKIEGDQPQLSARLDVEFDIGIPSLVGDPTTTIDLVPIDWVVNELLALTLDLPGAPDVVASAGEAAGSLERLLGVAELRLAEFRRALGHDYSAPTPIITRRRYEFLPRTSATWDIPEELRRRVRLVQRLQDQQAAYARYIEVATAALPRNVRLAAPAIDSYIDLVLDHWLQAEEDSLGRRIASSSRRQTLIAESTI